MIKTIINEIGKKIEKENLTNEETANITMKIEEGTNMDELTDALLEFEFDWNINWTEEGDEIEMSITADKFNFYNK